MYFQLFLMDKLLVSSLKITRNDYDLKKLIQLYKGNFSPTILSESFHSHFWT